MGIPIFSGLDRPLKKAHLPTACPRQAFKITALDALEDFSRSKRGGYDVPPKVVFARRFLARRSAELASKPF